jgi:uncharacterized protein (DUF1330 family)
MAKGYVIGRLTVLDPEGYKAYAAKASEAMRVHGGRPLVRGGRAETLEGEARTRNVVIEFDSFEAARAYYHSPEYQAALKLRLGISIGDLVAVEGAE